MAGYEVDLSYLQDTLKKLQGVSDGMDVVCGVSNYQTNIARSEFGGDKFIEAGNLFAAHDHMKTELTKMIATLKSMIQDFTDKTGSAHAQYAAQESQTGQTFLNNGAS
jgi:hypothetical protein